MPTPMLAATEGRNTQYPLRPDWDEIKNGVMYLAVSAKFLQHNDLRKKLLDTGQNKIIETTINDNYWGDNGDGTGKNMLGTILMEVRDSLINIESDQNTFLPPWFVFNDISVNDMFWRMGLGEDYLEGFNKWFLGLTSTEKKILIAKFPRSVEWQNFT